MAHEYKFSLLLANQYTGGPLAWNDNVLISANGALLNEVDVTRDCARAFKIAKSEVISIAISPCRKFIAVIEEACWLSIASLDSGKVLCRANVHSKSSTEPLVISWSPCGTKIMLTRGDIGQLYHAPMTEPSYNPISLLRTFRGSYGPIRHCAWSAQSEVMVLAGDDSKCRVYPVPRIEKMPTCTTLIGCRSVIKGCWMGGQTGLDVLAVDGDGMVCTWQTDYSPEELTFDFKRTRRQMFAPSVLKRQNVKIEVIDDEPTLLDTDPETNENNEEPTDDVEMKSETEKSSDDESSDDEPDQIKYRRTFKDFVNQKGERASPVTAADYNGGLRLLACAHENGVFALFEVGWALDASEYGSLIQVQRLTMENSLGLNRLVISPKGDWLALGGDGGQLIVWEWATQSYVLQQQCEGHSVSSVAYSPCGSKMATGGTDGHVKIWSTTSGFCNVTFKNHTSDVSGIAWMRSGFALVSSSKDGTVRAYDLRRYRNFRTLTTPTPQRLRDVSVDPGGELIAAAGEGTGSIFVWSVRTGRLLDEFPNHQSAVVQVQFSPVSCRLLSCSWDGSAVVTDFTDIEKVHREALECPSDMLTAVWRPDGDQIATSNLAGKIGFWDPKTAKLEFEMDCSRDIRAGRPRGVRVSAETLTDQGWSQLAYTNDGDYLFAGGKSFLVVLYSVKAHHMIGQFSITSNFNLDGLKEFLDSKTTMTEFGAIADIADASEVKLAGQKKSDRALRRFDGIVSCSALATSPAGNEFAIATGEGVSIYSKSKSTFASLTLHESATPANALLNIKSKNYGDGIIIAITLNDPNLIRQVIESIAIENVELLSKSLPDNIVIPLLTFIATELETTKHSQLYLRWCSNLLKHCGKDTLLKRKCGGIARIAARAVRVHREKILMNCYSNCSTIDYLIAQRTLKTKEKRDETMETENDID